MSSDSKTCTGCGESKSLSAFNRSKKTKDGHVQRCKVCCHDAYMANRDVVIERACRWQKANAEAHNRASREHKARTREHQIETTWAWRRNNYDRYLAQKRASERRRRVGRDPEAVVYADVLYGDRCSYCGAAVEEIDHIEPSAGGGSNSWDNLTAACRPCNTQKNARPLLMFLLTHKDYLRVHGLTKGALMSTDQIKQLLATRRELRGSIDGGDQRILEALLARIEELEAR